MMPRTYSVGAHTFRFNPPPTTLDVLDWTVWAQCLPADDPGGAAEAALIWACRWLLPAHTTGELDGILAEQDGNAFVHLVQLCNAIAAAAGLPSETLLDVATMLDRKNGVPPNFRGDPVCGCGRCRALARGVTHLERFPISDRCVFFGLRPEAIRAAEQIGDADLNMPLYVTQLRGVYARAESRKWEHEKSGGGRSAYLKALHGKAG